MTRLKLADLEIEKAEPLEVEMTSGNVYSLQDPRGVRVDSLVRFEELSPIDQAKAVIADGKFDEFSAEPDADGYFFEALMERYTKHFGLGEPGEGHASRPTSKGTARRSK